MSSVTCALLDRVYVAPDIGVNRLALPTIRDEGSGAIDVSRSTILSESY